MKRFLIPLAVFLVLVVFLAVGLKRDPREVPSPLVGKPAPEFRLDTLAPGKQFSPADMRGQWNALNQGREKQDKQQDHYPGHHA